MKFCEGVGDSEICKILLLLVCFDHNFGDFRVTGWIFQDVLVDPKLQGYENGMEVFVTGS